MPDGITVVPDAEAPVRSLRSASEPSHLFLAFEADRVQGVLSANDQVLGPLSYCHFPARTVMHHAPAGPHGCLFVTIFDGPFDVTPVPGLA